LLTKTEPVQAGLAQGRGAQGVKEKGLAFGVEKKFGGKRPNTVAPISPSRYWGHGTQGLLGGKKKKGR